MWLSGRAIVIELRNIWCVGASEGLSPFSISVSRNIHELNVAARKRHIYPLEYMLYNDINHCPPPAPPNWLALENMLRL